MRLKIRENLKTASLNPKLLVLIKKINEQENTHPHSIT